MKSFAIIATLASFVPSIVALTINTPSSVVQCQPARLEWIDGTAPYFLSILPGGQPSAAAIKTFPTQQGNSLTWIVDLPPNTGITLSLKDSTGTQAFSDTINIQSSPDSSCLNTSVEVSGASSGPTAAGNTASAPTGSGTNTPAPASTNPGNSAATSGASNTSSRSSSNTSSGAAPTRSNAANKITSGAYGLAGIMGLVGLAVL